MMFYCFSNLDLAQASRFLAEEKTVRTIFSSWGEEQHLSFVVLPKLKIDGAMLNST